VSGRAKPGLTAPARGRSLCDGAADADPALQLGKQLAETGKVFVPGPQLLREILELLGLLRTIHRLRELADLPLETKPVALQLEGYRIAVGERMLQLGEDRDRGVGFLL
jgi:hypothetical protein